LFETEKLENLLKNSERLQTAVGGCSADAGGYLVGFYPGINIIMSSMAFV
jgi:hypothetical protein